MQIKPLTKRQHKSTMFRDYFLVPTNFLHLLQHCRKRPAPYAEGDVRPFDLDSEAVRRSLLNDISFLTGDNRLLILIDHQSTVNANMALRLFFYYMELLQLWIKLAGVNLFGTAKIENLPLPEFYVAYAGKADPKEKTSTFQIDHEGVKIDITVNIVDIRFENLEDTAPENPLAGYSYFFKRMGDHKEAGMDGDEAFDKARGECIAEGYMKGFIEKEDFVMNYKDIFDYDVQLKQTYRAEGEAEGMAKGRAKGRAEGEEAMISIALRNNMPFDQVRVMAKAANIPNERLEELRAIAGA